MAKAKSFIPGGFRSLTQYLIVDGAGQFLEFIRNAFDATEKYMMRDSDGTVHHAAAGIGNSVIEFADAGPNWKAMPAGLHYYVKNCEQTYARALESGGISLYEPANREYGDREAGVRDPAGNFWFIATHLGANGYKPEVLQDLNTYFSVKESAGFLEFLEKAFYAEVIDKHLAGDQVAQGTHRRYGGGGERRARALGPARGGSSLLRAGLRRGLCARTRARL